MTTSVRAIINTALLLFSSLGHAIDVNESASIKDTNTTILGVNHIGLSVRNMDSALAFYQNATGFRLLSRELISNSDAADALYGREGVSVEIAILQAPNMMLELMAFAHNAQLPIQAMPARGPGMTHTCFQSPSNDSAWKKFVAAGAKPLTRGGEPIDLGGYGVTYGYAYDPEGNMIELEQVDAEKLKLDAHGQSWKELGYTMWMSQVALVSHDIERLMSFYQNLLGFQPYRTAELRDNEKAGLIADIDDLHLLGGWFRMSDRSKVIELWQYINPKTEEFKGQRHVTDTGYSFSLEVSDIQQEIKRLKAMGLTFVSEPIQLGGFWQSYTRDIDGNIFSLREVIDVDSPYSVRKLDSQ